MSLLDIPLGDALAVLAGGDTVEVAVHEGRCINFPLGCGSNLPVSPDGSLAFPSALYRRGWRITGLCSSCQDRVGLDGEVEDYEPHIVRGTD